MAFRWIWLAMALAIAGMASAAEDERRLTVEGEGRVLVAPDMATITLGVVTEARGAREAVDDNSRAMAVVLTNLRRAGLEERDIQTSNFSVSPRFDYSSRPSQGEVAGFIAQNTVTVRVRDLDRLGAILDEVLRDGANSFQGLQFGLEDPEPARDAARAAAVVEARRKAALYAEAAGVALGPLMSLSEAGTGMPQPQMMMRAEQMSMSDAVPVAAGELDVSTRVTLVFAIE